MWILLSYNPSAIHLLEQNQDKINWDNLSENPNAIHLCLTRLHTQTGVAEKFITDLVEVVGEVKLQDNSKTGKASVYGMTQSLPDAPVSELLKYYMDTVLDE